MNIRVRPAFSRKDGPVASKTRKKRTVKRFYKKLSFFSCQQKDVRL
ncbi:hypothetical protein B4113_0716 [Geobacillus sp. B4113_201601]|nr:hypothetical protein B4113_0716 [Geobacillus sp. B4113_201601]